MIADFTSSPCSSCGWTAGHTSRSIVDVICRYGETAESVNQREFKRFVEEIRQKWRPLSPTEEFWEPGYRGKGWTEEGAFSLCVFAEVTGDCSNVERHEPLCEAEKKNQVLFRPLDTLLGDIVRGPLFDPRPEDKIAAALSALLLGLKRQATNVMPSYSDSIELPMDFEELLRVTDGISGAGIPSETANTYLVSGIHGFEQGMRH